MRIGDNVKIQNYGGLYSSYYKMAELFNMSDWEIGRYPSKQKYNEIYKVIGVSEHYSTPGRIVVGIEDSEGKGYIYDLDSLRVVEKPYELSEELFLV